MMRMHLSETDISHFAMRCHQKNLKDKPPDVFPLSAPGINTLTIIVFNSLSKRMIPQKPFSARGKKGFVRQHTHTVTIPKRYLDSSIHRYQIKPNN